MVGGLQNNSLNDLDFVSERELTVILIMDPPEVKAPLASLPSHYSHEDRHCPEEFASRYFCGYIRRWAAINGGSK